MIVITGASEGIGYECAKVLLERTAAPILLTGRCAEKLKRARESLPPQQRERCAHATATRATRAPSLG